MYLLLWHRRAYETWYRGGDCDYYADLYSCTKCESLRDVYRNIAKIKWDVNTSQRQNNGGPSAGETKDFDFEVLRIDEEFGPVDHKIDYSAIDAAYAAVEKDKSEAAKIREAEWQKQLLLEKQERDLKLLAELKAKYEAVPPA